LKDNQIAQLRADLTWVSNNAAARGSEIINLRGQLQYTQQVVRQEIKKGEDTRRLWTVNDNTKHFSRLRVEELTKENEKLEEEEAELQKWFDKERGARGELEELKKRLYELSIIPDV
jgi:tRNA(Ile)-lysidine synthase TilS/MesJ